MSKLTPRERRRVHSGYNRVRWLRDHVFGREIDVDRDRKRHRRSVVARHLCRGSLERCPYGMLHGRKPCRPVACPPFQDVKIYVVPDETYDAFLSAYNNRLASNRDTIGSASDELR